jgi:diacylglycerol kinase
MINRKQLKKSLDHASKGLFDLIRQEQNLQIEILIGIFILILAFVLRLSTNDLSLVLLVITLVLLTELINSAVERAIDVLKPRIHNYVKEIKDIMAAASLLSVIVAMIIGLLIFSPYFKELSDRFLG